jgi:rubrerythrin
MTTQTSTDDLFAAYARTAPLLDLQFYLRRAEQKLATFDLPAQTVAAIAEMSTLEQQIANVDGTPTLKKRVWTLIDRYKTSFPGWAGNLGAPDYFVSYWTVRDALVKADMRVRFDSDSGTLKVHVDKFNPKNGTGGNYDAEGPISETQLHNSATWKRSEELHRERVPLRAVPLTEQELVEVIGDAMRQGEPVNTTAPKAAKPTPAARVRLLEQELAAKDRQIAELLQQAAARRPALARTPDAHPRDHRQRAVARAPQSTEITCRHCNGPVVETCEHAAKCPACDARYHIAPRKQNRRPALYPRQADHTCRTCSTKAA